MVVFREFDSGGKDRSAEDRRRHRELVEESIKKNIGSIIAEESIIGQSKDKKIKIPIRGIKEYKFIYGRNVPGVGSGDGSEKRGDRIGDATDLHKKSGKGQAGNQEGEDIYETEITIEELVNYLFDDLNLRISTEESFQTLSPPEISNIWATSKKASLRGLPKNVR